MTKLVNVSVEWAAGEKALVMDEGTRAAVRSGDAEFIRKIATRTRGTRRVLLIEARTNDGRIARAETNIKADARITEEDARQMFETQPGRFRVYAFEAK